MHKVTHKLTKKQREALLQDYVDGVPVYEIARKYGVHHSYPTILARRRGKPTRLNKTNRAYR